MTGIPNPAEVAARVFGTTYASPAGYLDLLRRRRHRKCSIGYSHYCDAYYCIEHNRWLEPTCGDPACNFCTRRTNRPLGT